MEKLQIRDSIVIISSPLFYFRLVHVITCPAAKFIGTEFEKVFAYEKSWTPTGLV